MTKKRKKSGRPPIPADQRRDKLVQIRVTAAELARYQRAAGESGLSEFIRRLADRAAKNG